MSVFELLIYFVSCSLDYFKSQLGSKKTTFISVAYQENVRKSSIKEPGLKVKFDKSKELLPMISVKELKLDISKVTN